MIATCKCIGEVADVLNGTGWSLPIALFMKHGNELVSDFCIELVLERDKRVRRAKKMHLHAIYCPFCGTKIELGPLAIQGSSK